MRLHDPLGVHPKVGVSVTIGGRTAVQSGALFFWGAEKSRSSTDRSGIPKVRQSSAEPLGFCRKVLQNGSDSQKPGEERFPKGSAELLFRPCKLFSPILDKLCGFGGSNPKNLSRLFKTSKGSLIFGLFEITSKKAL